MRKLFYFLSFSLACAYLFPLSVIANDTCSARFTYSAQGTTVSFKTPASLPPGTLHSWVFGDGSPGNGEANPVHIYAAPGTYWVKHYVLNQSANCKDSLIQEIHVPGADCPEPKFSYYIDSQDCRKIHFINATTPVSISMHFIWKFGDGTSSSEINPTHTYAANGNFNVCLVMETGNNCRRELCRVIEINCANPPPCNLNVKFEWRKDESDSWKIWFINQTIVPTTGAQYKWSFGDGTYSEERNPVHRYSSPGNYKVCLKVMLNNICVKEECHPIEIPPINCNIEPRFTWKIENEHPRKVFFYNQTIVPSTNVKYEWKFGDGSYSNEKDPIHLYEHAGEFEVCLTVKIGEDCKKTTCQKISIRDCDVKARFEWKRDATQWNKIWFANLSQPVGNIWRTYWTYGDGIASQDFNSVHQYQQPGKYYVCLKVQSLQECIVTYCDSITVRRPDTCINRSDFRYEVAAGNPLEYYFKPGQVNIGWKYYWDFGDGSSSTAITPAHKFNHAGEYKVCLTVVTYNQCRTSTCKEVRAGRRIDCDTVKLKFEYKRNPERPNQLSFTAVSQVTLIKQTWVISSLAAQLPFPVPVVIEANNPTYTFRDTGWYAVCLYATTVGECRKIYCERIHIERIGNSPITTGNQVNIFPNPASNSARIEFELEAAARVNIRVLDAAGSVKMELYAYGRAGNNNLTIPVDKLSNGFYLVEIRYANRMKLAKFQKS